MGLINKLNGFEEILLLRGIENVFEREYRLWEEGGKCVEFDLMKSFSYRRRKEIISEVWN